MLLCPFSIAALVSLISVDVSCNLLEELEDKKASLSNQPQPPQPWEQTEYSNQPQEPVKTLGRSFASNEGPRPERNYFSGSLSRETVDVPPALPAPSSGGCAGNPDFLNFPGSPSMVFNPGAHVNFVIGVPEDYKMDISDAPEGWKIITITAPEGSDAISLGPNLGLSPHGSGGLPGNGSSFPPGLDGLPISQFPFMRPLPSGSPTGSLMPEMRIAPKLSGSTDQHPEGNYPGSQISSTGRFVKPMGSFGSYPDRQYPGDLDSHSEPLKSGYRKPELQTPGVDDYLRPALSGSHPKGQYPYEMAIPSGPQVYDHQPGSQNSGINGFSRPSGQPETHPDSLYLDNLNIHLPGTQTPGQLKFPRTHGPSERYPEGTYPDDRSPSMPPAIGYSPGSKAPGMRYPDGQYPDDTNRFPGSRTPAMEIFPRHREPTDRQNPEDINSSPGRLAAGYNEPGYQTPGTRKLPGIHQPSDRYPDGAQPDDVNSPSGSLMPGDNKPSSQAPGTGRFFRPSGQADSHPDDQYPDDVKFPQMHPGSRTPDMGISPRQQGPYGRRYPDDLSNDSGPSPIGLNSLMSPGYKEPGSQSPGIERSSESYQPSDRYPDGMQPDGLSRPSGPQLQILKPDSQTLSGTGRFPSPIGQSDTYPDGQFPDNMNLHPRSFKPGMERPHSVVPNDLSSPRSSRPGSQTPEMEIPLGLHRPSDRHPDGLYPDDTISPLGPGFHEPDSPNTLGKEKFARPIGQHESYPDGQFAETQTPRMGMSPRQYGLPDGQYPGAQRSPSGAPEFINPSHSVGMPGRYPDGQYPDGMSRHSRPLAPGYTPGTATPDSGVPLPSGQRGSYPNGQNPIDQISPSSSLVPRFNELGFQKPGMENYSKARGPGVSFPDGSYGSGPLGSRFDEPTSPAPETGIRSSKPYEKYPASQSPDGKSPYPGSLVPGYRIPAESATPRTRTVLSSSGSDRFPDGQYPEMVGYPRHSDGPGMRPEGHSPDYISGLPRSQAPEMEKPLRPSMPSGGHFRDQNQNDATSPLRFPTQGQSQPGQQSPGSGGSHGPSWETGMPPDRTFPRGLNRPKGYLLSGTEIPFLASGSTEIYPSGQYPDEFGGLTHPLGPGYKPGHLLSNMEEFPQLSGPSQRNPDSFNRPQGFQILGTEKPLLLSGSTEMYPSGRYPDDTGGLTHPQRPGYKPGRLLPGIKGSPQPQLSGPFQMYPDNFNRPQSLTPVSEQPFLLSRSTEIYPGSKYPDDSGSLFHTLGHGYKPRHLIQGIKGVPEPSGPYQRYPDGQFPDNMKYAPGQQASSPRYQPGHQVSGMESFPRPSGPYPEGQIQGRPEMLLGPATKGQYPENVNMPSQNFPQGYIPQLQEVPGKGKSPGQSRPVKQGSDVQFPEYVRDLLEPYLTTGENKPSLSPSGRGRSPRPSGSPERYPDNQYPNGQYPSDGHYPDSMVNRPGNMGPGFTQPGSRSPGEGRPVSPIEPLGRYPTDQYNQSPVSLSYKKPGYQTIPHGTQDSNSGETSMNTMDFPEEIKQAQVQDGIAPTGAYGGPPRNTAPHPGSPDYSSSAPGRSPTEKETEPHSPLTMDGPSSVERSGPSGVGSPSGMMRPQTPRGSPQSPENTGFTDGGPPSRTMNIHQSQPLLSTIGGALDGHATPVQDGSSGGAVPQAQSPPSFYTTGGLQSQENRAPSNDGLPTGTMADQQNPSMGLITRGGPHYDASPSGRNTSPQGSSMHMIPMAGSTQSGPGHDGPYSGRMTEPQGSQMHTGSMGSPQGGQMRTIMMGGPQATGNEGSQSGSMRPLNPSGSSMIIRYPQSPSMNTAGGYGGQSMGSDGSMRMIPSVATKTYGSGSPQSHVVQTTTYQSTPAITTMYYHSNPQSHIRGGHITYSSPAPIQYYQPRQTMVSRWPGSSSVSMPSYSQSYVQQPMNALRSLDTE